MMDNNFKKMLNKELKLGEQSSVSGKIIISYDGRGNLKLSSSTMRDTSNDFNLKDIQE
jgi:hypothetical protein